MKWPSHSLPRENYQLSIVQAEDLTGDLHDWLVEGGPTFYMAWNHQYFLVATSHWDSRLQEQALHCLTLSVLACQEHTQTVR